MKTVAVIPARYASTRMPGKPLADICGKPMIWWVYQQVTKSKLLNDVFVAADDERIAAICEQYGINYIMTSDKQPTSTQRVFEVATAVKSDYYVCINGDEPLIDPDIIDCIVPNEIISELYVANLITKISNPVEVIDNSNIKVVTNYQNDALFMSRSPIPCPKSSLDFDYYKHLGVLIYNYDALEFFNCTEKGKNELIEDINELRFIENGQKLKTIMVNANTLSVDTPKDLEKVRAIIQQKLNNGELTNE